MSGRDASGIWGPTVSGPGKAISHKKPGRLLTERVLTISPAWSQRHVALTYLTSLPRLTKIECDNLSPAASMKKKKKKKRIYFHEKQADMLKSSLPLGPVVWERGF